MTETTPHESGVDGRAIAKRAAFFVVVAVAAVVGISALPGVDEVRDRLAGADPRWLVAVAACAIASMLGFVRALWAVFDRVVPWRRALVLGLPSRARTSCCPPAARAGRPSARSSCAGRRARRDRRPAPRGAVPRHERGRLRRPGHRRDGEAIGLLPGDAPLFATLLPARRRGRDRPARRLCPAPGRRPGPHAEGRSARSSGACGASSTTACGRPWSSSATATAS